MDKAERAALDQPIPRQQKYDAVLQKMGEDYSVDEIHNMRDEVNSDGEEMAQVDSEPNSGDDKRSEEEFDASAALASGNSDDDEESDEEGQPQVTDEQAEAIIEMRTQMTVLQSASDNLRSAGLIREAVLMEQRLAAERKRHRSLLKTKPELADSFLRLRKAEAEEWRRERHRTTMLNQQAKEAAAAVAAKNAAQADLNNLKRKLAEIEGQREAAQSMRRFTLGMLGEGTPNAGGAKGRNNRFQLMDRLKNLRAGLSGAQINEYHWWREAWDKKMLEVHGAAWPAMFGSWMKAVQEDPKSNAFSLFMFTETQRVLSDVKGLAVPGIGK